MDSQNSLGLSGEVPEYVQLDVPGAGQGTSFEETVRKVVREEMASFHGQLRAIELSLRSLSSQVGQSNERIKEVSTKVSKEAEPPKKLLSQAGLIIFKKTVFENLHHSAESREEKDLFSGLVQDLRVNNNLVHDSAKSEADLLQGFRLTRSVMRQQIKRRLNLDLGKKDHELKDTTSYLGKNLGSLPGVEGMKVVYNAAYVLAKYMNLENPTVGKREDDQRKAGKKAIWDLSYRRNEVDPMTLEQLKIKVKNAVVGGFRPLE